MIKILREGNKKQVECNDCGALLQYEGEDIHCEEIYTSPMKYYNRRYITCPQCKNKIILEATR